LFSVIIGHVSIISGLGPRFSRTRTSLIPSAQALGNSCHVGVSPESCCVNRGTNRRLWM
jgi:hypothetical protein